MKGVYVQQNSPYYWIRYYDKFEQDPQRKRKSGNTKIEVTPSDWKRFTEAKKKKEKPKLQGTPELNKLVKSFRYGLAERNLIAKSGVKLRKDLKLSEGLKEFKFNRSVPGKKNQLKEKTLVNYDIAVNHVIVCCGNKLIYKYSDKDYIKLLYFFEEKNLSINSRSIYTRALNSLWKYFIEKMYASKNIMEPTEEEEKDPEPIPSDEMYTIVQYFKEDTDYPHHYWIVYFMLLTGCRPSTAIVQLKEDIDFKRKRITMQNIKSGKRKKKLLYAFPLYKELQNLIKEMGVIERESGRLFHMYAVVPQNYTWPLSFWKRGINFLYKGKKISKQYSIKQIRSTFISFLINVLKMDIYVVFKLADHADIKVTNKHYISFNINEARKELDEITFESFLEEKVL